MIVLARKKDERIKIGSNIVLQIVSIRGAKVRIGIEAPREVKVLREELLEKEARDDN